MTAAITYRLLSLEFRGMKPRAMFNGALMKHAAGCVEITNLRTPPAVVDDYLAEIAGREVSSIRYQIIARNPGNGRRLSPPVAFCHDFSRGDNVRLAKVGKPAKLFLVRDHGRRFFSDAYRLPERLRDKSLPDQPVYQFD